MSEPIRIDPAAITPEMFQPVDVLELTIDDSSFVDVSVVIDRLRVEIAKAPEWLKWLAELAAESLQESVELLPCDLELLPASGASQLRIRAKASDGLLRLVAAVRAGNGERGPEVDLPFGHGGSRD